jgi:hypothetical protein
LISFEILKESETVLFKNCKHHLCTSCSDILFQTCNTILCPYCRADVKKTDILVLSKFKSYIIEKEIEIEKQIEIQKDIEIQKAKILDKSLEKNINDNVKSFDFDVISFPFNNNDNDTIPIIPKFVFGSFIASSSTSNSPPDKFDRKGNKGNKKYNIKNNKNK